ncbi:MAG: protein translocase subunit SecD [Candidatus Harrisonbacteria bacterium]|nr:protein translocase subunit SecD [Candidatus Harrisonbacteria bacterium]
MNSATKNLLLFLLIAFLFVGAAFFVYPKGLGGIVLPWRLGLDLVGGSYLIYEVDMSEVAPADQDSVLAGLRDVMERRVNVFGVSEPRVTTAVQGDSHQIIVELAGIKDTAEAIRLIGRTALLDFREVEAIGEGEEAQLDFKKTTLTGKYLQRAVVTTNPTTNEPVISIQFNSEGGAIFSELTEKNVGEPLAIFLDDELISMPVVQEKIPSGNAQISGGFDFNEAKRLAQLLNAGALPAPIHIISEQTIGATLGTDSLNKAITAGALGTLAIILFMIIYYRRLGYVAALALIFYVIFTVSVFKLFGITMTLAGIAGFILSIGMAVDANILIFARSKEEIAKGISLATSLEEGFKRAWPSIRDSNITTIITSVILYYLTSSFVRGFALALLIGVLISMFSAITVTRVMLRLFIKNHA